MMSNEDIEQNSNSHFKDRASSLSNNKFEVVKFTGKTEEAINRPKFDIGVALIVDDNPSNCQLLQIMLRRLGVHADIAESMQSCLEQMREKEYSVIFMDLKMPGGTGYEAREAITNGDGGEAHCEVPMIAYTASVSVNERNEAAEAGFQDVLTKPLRIIRLGEALQHIPIRKRVDSDC